MFVSKTKMPTLLAMVTLSDAALIEAFIFVSHHPRGQGILGTKVYNKIKNVVMQRILKFSFYSFFYIYLPFTT